MVYVFLTRYAPEQHRFIAIHIERMDLRSDVVQHGGGI